MLVNRLYVVPNEPTMAYLSSLTSGAPVDVDPSTFKVEIISTAGELDIDPDRTYHCKAINVGVYYDTTLQRSNLIVTFTSPEIQERYHELLSEGVTPEFYDFCIPHMTLRKDTPPMNRHFRTWKLQMANALCQNEKIFVFGNEHVDVENLQAVPDYDYMMAMANDMRQRHNRPPSRVSIE